MNGDGVLSEAFRLAPNAGEPDGIVRSVLLQGGVTYRLSAEAAQSNESGDVNGGETTVHLQMNGAELASAQFGDFGAIGPGQVFRTNLNATFTPPSNGLYRIGVRMDRGWTEYLIWAYLDDVRIQYPQVFPAGSGDFGSGVWSGQIRVGGPASNLVLRAEGAEGHYGESLPFTVLPDADLAVRAVASAARVGTDFTVSLTVSNAGPSVASGVVLTNILGGDVAFVSFVASQGVCANTGNGVRCDFGSLTNGQRVSATLTARPSAIGIVTNIAFVSASEPDFVADNNTATTLISVAPPFLYVGSAIVPEGDSGTTSVQLAVWLGGPSGQTISVDYATANGSAVAGSDYVSGVGQLVFPPGMMTQWVTVQILGDLLDEPNESFSVNLFNPTNVALAQGGTGLVTITDNDPPVTIFIGDVVVIEGSSGTTPAAFPVTLSQPSGLPSA